MRPPYLPSIEAHLIRIEVEFRESLAPDRLSQNVVLETLFDRFEVLRTIGQR